MSGKYCAAVSNRKISAALSVFLLEVAAKHISKTTAITSVQWHAIYMALPGEIKFVVTTHKINNSERNSGHSSTERNSIITGCELEHSPFPAEEGFLSLDYLYHFVCMSAFSSQELMWNLDFHVRTKSLTLNLKDFQGFWKQASHLKSCKIFIVHFLLILPIVMLLTRACGITGESCAHTIMRLRQQSCPVAAERQMHTNGLWNYTDMQRGSARRWAASSLACQCLSCPIFLLHNERKLKHTKASNPPSCYSYTERKSKLIH